MSPLRSLLFFWRSQLLVCIGVCVAAAVLIGSLALGDSVQQGLQQSAAERLGLIRQGVVMQGRFMRQQLAQRLRQHSDSGLTAVLTLRGMLSDPQSGKRHPRVLVHGVDEHFFSVAAGESPVVTGLEVNQALADYLDVSKNAEVILRVEQPGLLSRDAPLTPDDETLVTLRQRLAAVRDPASLGNFQLSANHDQVMNVFLPLAQLQQLVAMDDWVNQVYSSEQVATLDLQEALDEVWQLADAGIDVQSINGRSELTSQRIFIDDQIGTHIDETMHGVLGYMVNAFKAGDRRTPYSIVAGLDPELIRQLPGQTDTQLTDEQIVINQWLAEDLNVAVGDRIDVLYYEVQSNNDFIEREISLTLAGICPIEGLAADASLMPPFPGLDDKDDCRDWDPGTQIELDQIRDKDEAYWDQWRGAPKAFVSLSLARRLWSNRFGNATAYRGQQDPQQLRSQLHGALIASDFGLQSIAIAQRAEEAGAAGARYITSVFVSLNMFLVLAALLLMLLFYRVSVQQRIKEMGLLTAVGFTTAHVRRRLLTEIVAVLLLSLFIGSMLAWGFLVLMTVQLQDGWSDAVAAAPLHASMSAGSVMLGCLIIVFVVLVLSYHQLCVCLRESPQMLLRGVSSSGSDKLTRRSLLLPVLAAVLSLVLSLLCLFLLPLPPNDPLRFFSAAMLLLIAGLFLVSAQIRRAQRIQTRMNHHWLLRVFSWRRAQRHVLLLATMAACVFLIMASAAFYISEDQISLQRDSGTGGFAWFGETSIPLEHNLNTRAGRRACGIDDADLNQTYVLQMRSNNDDELSCLNLNQAVTPRLWGLNPDYLIKTDAFRFMQSLDTPDSPWQALQQKREGRIPVIGDVNAILWSMGKGLGSRFAYPGADGTVYELEVVGLVQDSVLQGGLLMDERFFTEMFPDHSGYQHMLIDVPPARSEAVASMLERSLSNSGLVLETTPQRLARYLAVRNTYIVIFQVIGALGICLGSIGLGALIMRHVYERRSEFALLRSLGFSSLHLRRMVFWEHAGVLLLALLLGGVTAAVAIVPVASHASQLLTALLPVGGVLVCGLTACSLACRMAMRGTLLSALRNE